MTRRDAIDSACLIVGIISSEVSTLDFSLKSSPNLRICDISSKRTEEDSTPRHGYGPLLDSLFACQTPLMRFVFSATLTDVFSRFVDINISVPLGAYTDTLMHSSSFNDPIEVHPIPHGTSDLWTTSNECRETRSDISLAPWTPNFLASNFSSAESTDLVREMDLLGICFSLFFLSSASAELIAFVQEVDLSALDSTSGLSCTRSSDADAGSDSSILPSASAFLASRTTSLPYLERAAMLVARTLEVPNPKFRAKEPSSSKRCGGLPPEKLPIVLVTYSSDPHNGGSYHSGLTAQTSGSGPFRSTSAMPEEMMN
ncbi:uncharacterized protein FOMMEDRAFT_160734 [Fomitiporia mediterranea MF3/22]|uniref:uncharacterized protein n=1 Tax=Fomitiporia mediterranea (strain MF3/22) TaxID=694068 RepID=UPI000440930A|nr:uncharacterized protein FOMMEDRAFT_160734 [Fomitiporia mediterranea MF3/22]EJC99164.1 hypothetical protein FOMMEDRAFT_160734 [Fomitiporia mediterranea MF3/22]